MPILHLVNWNVNGIRSIMKKDFVKDIHSMRLMMKSFIKVLLVVFLFTISAKGQNIQQFYLYSYDHSLFNPAGAGAENKHVFGVNGQMNYNREGGETDIYTGLVSYNGNFSTINSGIGVIGIVDVFGTQTTSKIGLSYNYRIGFAPKISLRIGLRPTISKLSINDNEERFNMKPDIDLGLWLDIAGVYLGASLNNTFDHKYDVDSEFADQLDPSGNFVNTGEATIGDAFSDPAFTLIAGSKIKIPGLELDPSVAFIKAGNNRRFYLNSNFIIGNVFVLGGSYIKELNSDWYNIGLNGGFNVFKKFQIVGIFYTRNYHRPDFDRDYNTLLEGIIRVKI